MYRRVDRDEEPLWQGQAYDITRGELPTWSLWNRYFGGRTATLNFRLTRQFGDPPDRVAHWEVETRDRWVLGTVFKGDWIIVQEGWQDKQGIIRASRILDTDTGAVVRGYRPPLPWRKIWGWSLLAAGVLILVLAILLLSFAYILSGLGGISIAAGIFVLRTPRREGELVARGTVQVDTIERRNEPAWWGARMVSVWSFKIRVLEPAAGEPEFAMVELRAPRLRGQVLEDDEIRAYGEVTDGLVKAVRIVNSRTSVTIGDYRPPPPWFHFIGIPLVLVGLNTIVVALAYIDAVLTGFDELVSFLIGPIIFASVVSVVAGVVLVLVGVIALIRGRRGRFPLAVGVSLLVPVIVVTMLALIFASGYSNYFDIGLVLYVPLLGVVLFVAGTLLVREESHSGISWGISLGSGGA